MDNSIRNELLGTLADVNELISSTNSLVNVGKKEEVEVMPQLLDAYSLKVKILEMLKNI